MLEQSIGKTVRVIPEDSEALRYERFTDSKEFDFDSVSMGDSNLAMQGEGAYSQKKAYQVRILWHHNDTPWGFVVRGDSEIQTIYDLKKPGVRVAVSAQSPPMVKVSKEALPAFLGWTPEEAAANWIFVPKGSYAENCLSVTDGSADVSYVSPVSTVTYEMESHPKGLRWLPMPASDKEGWARWLAIRSEIIPCKFTWGVPSAIGVESFMSNYLYWTRPDVDNEYVYRMAKWLNENYDAYKGKHTTCTRMSLEQFRSFLNYNPFPVAEGTIKYLREIGQWTATDDKAQEDNIALMERHVQARNAAMDEAKSKGIKIHYQNQEYLDTLARHMAGIPKITAAVE